MSHCDAIIVDSGPGGALAAEGDYFPGVAGTGSSNAKGAKADELLVEMSTSTTWNHRMTRSPIVLAKARLQLAVWALAISACSGGTEPEPPAAVSTVTVSPSTLHLVSGSTGTLTAVFRDAAGNILSGRAVTWASSAEQVATVSQQGVVIAFATGPATISATSEGRAGSATVAVTPGLVATVTVTPNNPSAPIWQKVQLHVAAFDDHGNPVTDQPVSWQSEDDRVASVALNSGEVSTWRSGSTRIVAWMQGVQGSTRVDVTDGLLQLHQINVGSGGALLVRGPSGVTVLLEAGNTGDGTGRVVPYLKSVGLQPIAWLDGTIAGHQHCDHVGGLDEVIQAGYNVLSFNVFNGSSTTSSCTDEWQTAATTTTAGAIYPAPLGLGIPLGGGAVLRVVAVNGEVLGGDNVNVSDEHDRSIAVLVKYGGFDYLWASDLGGGDSDNACTGRSTSQANVESSVIKSISPGGGNPLISSGGIDVLHVNNHGSESSTNAEYMNLARPAVALIGTGAGQGANFLHPRKAVLENVLLAQAACITAPPALVLQNEEGAPSGTETSFAGYSVGNILISTDGKTEFRVSADGLVTHGPVEVLAAGLPRTFPLDDGAGPTVAQSLRPSRSALVRVPTLRPSTR